MTDKQENYLSMCKAVQQTCNTYPNSWSGLPAFVTQFGEFNTLVSEIESAKTIQETNITGFTLDKKAKREELTELAVRLAKGVAAYALVINDNGLMAQVNYSKSQMYNSRDEIVISQAQIVHEKAHENLDNLGDFNITEPMIEQLQELIGEYAAISQLPSTKSDIKEAATSLIVTVIKNLRERLKIMDHLVEILKPDHQNFYDIYKNSREIYDLGGRRTPVDPDTVIEEEE
jgi:hypothetical protein